MRSAKIALALAALSLPMAAVAQTAKPTPPTEMELANATETLSLFVSAFNSKDVPAETKAGLMLCLYDNPLGKVARGMQLAYTEDPKLKTATPVQRLVLLTKLCGVSVPATKGQAPAKKPPAKRKGK